MERYLLDTNIVIYYFSNPEELERKVSDILDDYNSRFYVSTVSVQEIIHLYQRGKIKTGWKKPEDILPAIESMNYELLPVKREHLAVYASLSVKDNHNDPNDHIIISQAIAERLTLISSDSQFIYYVKQKLRFIFNER